jgi:hypothetical protein
MFATATAKISAASVSPVPSAPPASSVIVNAAASTAAGSANGSAASASSLVAATPAASSSYVPVVAPAVSDTDTKDSKDPLARINISALCKAIHQGADEYLKNKKHDARGGNRARITRDFAAVLLNFFEITSTDTHSRSDDAKASNATTLPARAIAERYVLLLFLALKDIKSDLFNKFITAKVADAKLELVTHKNFGFQVDRDYVNELFVKKYSIPKRSVNELIGDMQWVLECRNSCLARGVTYTSDFAWTNNFIDAIGFSLKIEFQQVLNTPEKERDQAMLNFNAYFAVCRRTPQKIARELHDQEKAKFDAAQTAAAVEAAQEEKLNKVAMAILAQMPSSISANGVTGDTDTKAIVTTKPPAAPIAKQYTSPYADLSSMDAKQKEKLTNLLEADLQEWGRYLATCKTAKNNVSKQNQIAFAKILIVIINEYKTSPVQHIIALLLTCALESLGWVKHPESAYKLLPDYFRFRDDKHETAPGPRTSKAEQVELQFQQRIQQSVLNNILQGVISLLKEQQKMAVTADASVVNSDQKSTQVMGSEEYNSAFKVKLEDALSAALLTLTLCIAYEYRILKWHVAQHGYDQYWVEVKHNLSAFFWKQALLEQWFNYATQYGIGKSLTSRNSGSGIANPPPVVPPAVAVVANASATALIPSPPAVEPPPPPYESVVGAGVAITEQPQPAAGQVVTQPSVVAVTSPAAQPTLVPTTVSTPAVINKEPDDKLSTPPGSNRATEEKRASPTSLVAEPAAPQVLLDSKVDASPQTISSLARAPDLTRGQAVNRSAFFRSATNPQPAPASLHRTQRVLDKSLLLLLAELDALDKEGADNNSPQYQIIQRSRNSLVIAQVQLLSLANPSNTSAVANVQTPQQGEGCELEPGATSPAREGAPRHT